MEGSDAMDQGLIHVSEPKFFSKNQCIQFRDGHRKIICILKGVCITDEQQILCSGDVFGKEQWEMNVSPEPLMVLEDTVVIAIEGQGIDKVKEKELLNHILTSTVGYITEMKEKLC